MSIYSTSLKKQVLEPRQFNQQRCEFRLDSGGTMYFTNLRLINLGCGSSAGNDVYNHASGAYSVIKQLVLLDGSQELERCDETNRYLAWYNALNKNEDNFYVNQKLAKHKLGYRMNDIEEKVDANFAIANTMFRHEVGNEASAINQSIGSGWLDLRNCLPLLKALGALDTALMPNLRLQIEWESDARVCLKNDTTRNIRIFEPLLVCDEIVDESMKAGLRAQMKDTAWKTYEHDLVIVPEGARSADRTDNDGIKQTSAITINGFDNKYIHRLVAMKAYSDPATSVGNGDSSVPIQANESMGNGVFVSRAQHREKVQFKVNGSNLLVGEGLTSPAMKADLHDECWGSLNIVPCGIFQSVGLDNPRDATNNTISRGANVVGQAGEDAFVQSSMLVGASDYIGVRIEERISDLQFRYERSCLFDDMVNKVESAELAVHFYAEVPKQLTMDGKGSYTIQYL